MIHIVNSVLLVLIDQIDVASYIDDNTSYTMGQTPQIIDKFKMAGKKLFNWFSDNGIKANPQRWDSFGSLEANTHIIFVFVSVIWKTFPKLLE